ncbi:MAG: N-acetylmuramoyl-L-alanine amidase [Balneolaceae bacterium]|nr:N-acetylmuramoyl-L-alanine amidase [Balneolaceae bacterium]
MRGCFCFLLLACLPLATLAQLNRVSTAERSDGKGHVIRFHMTQEADSFQVFQPEVNLIQMAVYGEDIDTAGVELDNLQEAFDEISLYDIPSGVGVDVYLAQDEHYLARSYHDGSSSDLLLALTRSGRSDVQALSENHEPVMWSRFTVQAESLLARGGSDSDVPMDETYEKMKDKIQFDRVVIDAGHGGHDPGSIGYRGVYEKDIVLTIAKKVGGYIEESEEMQNVEVIYTRSGDEFYDLEERGSIANRAEGDLFVSIHANSSASRQAHGTETYFLGTARTQSALETMKRENSVANLENGNSDELTQEQLLTYELLNSGYIASSEELAGMIQDQLANRAQRRSRGVKQAGFIVLFHASMPAVLIETGFISNPGEARYLSSDWGQSIVASAIFRAIRNYKVQYDADQHLTTKEEERRP